MFLPDNYLLLKESDISKLIFQCNINRLCCTGRRRLVLSHDWTWNHSMPHKINVVLCLQSNTTFSKLRKCSLAKA